MPKEKRQSPPAEEVAGPIDRIVFSNPSNGYAVLSVELANIGSATVVGSISSPQEGGRYKFSGHWKEHPRYGRQFHMENYEIEMPSNEEGVARYLSSVAYGVGPVTAERIVKALGQDCLEKIKRSPEILDGLKFLSEAQKKDIAGDLIGNSLLAEFKAKITRKGVSVHLAERIWAHYLHEAEMPPEEILTTIEDNPYILCDIERIGFLTADKIAMSLGMELDSPFRLQSGILHTLKEATNDGHVYLPAMELMKRARKLLGVRKSPKDMGVMIKKMADDQGLLIREGNDVYLLDLHRDESLLSEHAKRIINSDSNAHSIAMEDVEGAIAEQSRVNSIEYAPEQVEAMRMTFSNNLSIITGGPGTGKSEILKGICGIYERFFPNGNIYLASPTGKAAKRMEEATGRDAKTIHRLLKYSPFEGGFTHSAAEPLGGPGLLVIDEISMADLWLSRCLLEAIPDNIKVVLVGDANQLPSVGAGSVLRDMLESGSVPSTRLRYNFRQAGGSAVAKRANEIVEGMEHDLETEGDFHVAKVSTDEQAAEMIVDWIRRNKDKMDLMGFQVLSPMRKGHTGVNSMNERIRDIMNPERPGEKEVAGFRARDKVIVTKNNYNLMVFNGDMGAVSKVGAGFVEVKLDNGNGGSAVKFQGDDLHILSLAYALTIHKSQGSEFRIVLMALTNSHYIMLKRNLLYTGITRAKERLILVANKRAYNKARKDNAVENRYSKLKERLQ